MKIFLSFCATLALALSAAARPQPQAPPNPAGRVVGTVTAVKADTKEIRLRTRGADGAGRQVTIDAAGPQVRFLRLAPDSLSVRDAVPSSFADLRVGDQLRVTGARSADGARLTAEEVVSGSILRVGGTVTSVNAAANEITIKTPVSRTPIVVALGQRTQLRRLTPVAAAEVAQAAEARARAAQRANQPGGAQRAAPADANKPDTTPPAGNTSGSSAGRTVQELFRSLPAVTPAELKQGDAVLVTGTPGADAARLTAIILLTGDEELLGRLQRLQPGRDGENMSPGLPGDVLGGGVSNETRGTTDPRDPRQPPP
ncbi:MAG TPA: hypothetical protein VF546_05370 [Pyrinomonadaceae bacterium]|jgi:hypothetical protein